MREDVPSLKEKGDNVLQFGLWSKHRMSFQNPGFPALSVNR